MKLSYSAIVMGVLCISAVAQADPLKFTGTNLSNTRSGSITVNGEGPRNVMIGKLNFTTGTSTIETYCADALRTLNTSFHDYTSLTVDTQASGNLALAGRIIAKSYDGANTADQQAGLQLAIWSALYDGGTSFTANGSNFEVDGVSGGVLSYASTYYSQGKNYIVPATKLVTLYSSQAHGAQSQMTVSTVPEPATMTALALGAAAMLRRRRK